ncbi:uncharacterized protein DS421_20g688680 [Arachis hypogaea]|nr:uncharacterized protein DS421_20g688680 [Arachis hypogaea]
MVVGLTTAAARLPNYTAAAATILFMLRSQQPLLHPLCCAALEGGRISRRAVASPSPRRAAAPCPRRRAHSISVTPPGLLVDLPVAVWGRATDDSEGEDTRLVEPHPVPAAPPPLCRRRTDRRRGKGPQGGKESRRPAPACTPPTSPVLSQ